MNETSANIQVDSESESEGEISELWETDSDLEYEGWIKNIVMFV